MKSGDRKLGMDRPISRRDFLNGAAAFTAATAMPGETLAALDASGTLPIPGYPPARTGLRGSHPGSYEVAHELMWQGRQEWGRIQLSDEDVYDLAVVGAGISGLAAAYFYRQEHPDARILILDNHDDFGGHAKRNEFRLDGRTIIGYGGSQALENPGSYRPAAQTLLRDIGVDPAKFETYYDHEFFRRHGLAGATYFDADTFGSDLLVRYPLMDYSGFLALAPPSLDAREAVALMPVGDNARRELLQLLEAQGDRLTGIPGDEQLAYLWRTSYREFLTRHMGITDEEVFGLYQGLTADSCASMEAASALSVMSYVGLPGLQATALADFNAEDEPYIFHFPDGNASIARLLVRDMIPGVAPGSSMDDIVLARFDYSKLDDADSAVRIRLNSTAVRVEHEGSPAAAEQVLVTYVTGGAAQRVRARACVMAGYNAMIPKLCPEVPRPQAEALTMAIKSPIIYTSVLLRNWRALEKLGVGFFAAPGAYYAVSMLDFPVSMGGYRFSAGPGEPIVIHMERFAVGPDPTLPPREQRLAGRRELYTTSFEDIERATRRQLAGALAGGGFDPARDIAAITVNRWGHGYANWYSGIFDPTYDEDSYPHVIGRKGFGRIAIANSDAAASASVNAAIDQAYRAVQELG